MLEGRITSKPDGLFGETGTNISQKLQWFVEEQPLGEPVGVLLFCGFEEEDIQKAAGSWAFVQAYYKSIPEGDPGFWSQWSSPYFNMGMSSGVHVSLWSSVDRLIRDIRHHKHLFRWFDTAGQAYRWLATLEDKLTDICD